MPYQQTYPPFAAEIHRWQSKPRSGLRTGLVQASLAAEDGLGAELSLRFTGFETLAKCTMDGTG